MKIQALAQFTKQQNLAGSDSAQVLDKFLLYAKLCRDPVNIFTYMEEKAICVFISHYWVAKADYYAEIGDYKSAFQFINEAQTRTGISDEQEQRIVHPQFHLQKYKKEILSEMRRQPANGKRSAEQFQFVSTQQQSISGDDEKKNQKLLNLWNTRFSYAKRELQKKAQIKRQSFPYSWMYEIYKEKQEKEKKISETIKSLFQQMHNKDQPQMHRSLNTPFKKRDPKRISKTIDSVQMLKRKKSTGEKMSKKDKYDGQASEQDNQQSCISQTRFAQSIPVGRSFSLLKKHVTFRKNHTSNVEKIRQKSQKSLGISVDNKSQKSEKGFLRRSIMRNSSKSPQTRELTPEVQRTLNLKMQTISEKSNKQQ